MSDSAGLGLGPRLCITNKFPGDADLLVQGTRSEMVSRGTLESDAAKKLHLS